MNPEFSRPTPLPSSQIWRSLSSCGVSGLISRRALLSCPRAGLTAWAATKSASPSSAACTDRAEPADGALCRGTRGMASKLRGELPHDSEECTMTGRAEEMVPIPRADLDALLAENRRLRREAGDAEALRRIRSDSGEGRILARQELAEAWGISELPG